jgi:drug/metabolite transporter (DMT)-like permease
MAATTQTRQDWLAMFVVLSAIWGASFLFIKVGDRAFDPILVAFLRCALGAAALLLMLVARREPLPRSRRLWAHVFVLAIFFNSVPFALFAWGETEVSSAVAGILNATTPLNTLLVAMAVLPGERPTHERVAGLGVGFVGVVVVIAPWSGLQGRLLGSLACLGAAACYGVGFPYTRRYLTGRPESAVTISAAQVLCGTLQLALIVPWTTAAPHSFPLDAVLSMIALGAGGTGIAYVINYEVIRRAGATLASTVTYLVPIWATVLGVVVLGEDLSWHQPAGAAIVLIGVALAQGRLSRLRRG